MVWEPLAAVLTEAVWGPPDDDDHDDDCRDEVLDSLTGNEEPDPEAPLGDWEAINDMLG